MRKLMTTSLLLTLLTIAFASFVFQEYSATPSTDKVIIQWKTKAETGVAQFIILRSPDDETYSQITEVNVAGTGFDYEYIDENVFFKGSETFFYKIRAVRNDGSTVEETQSLIVNPNISGIFRTWGAIKAMFR